MIYDFISYGYQLFVAFIADIDLIYIDFYNDKCEFSYIYCTVCTLRSVHRKYRLMSKYFKRFKIY